MIPAFMSLVAVGPVSFLSACRMLNRNAILVRARQPYLDWINKGAPSGSRKIELPEVGQTLYLVPEFEDAMGATQVLRQVFHDIFCRELEGWSRDQARWPRDLTLPLFREWFEIAMIGTIEDVGDGPIENDEGPEERHRFTKPPRPKPGPRRR